jgi:hypothetical protein
VSADRYLGQATNEGAFAVRSHEESGAHGPLVRSDHPPLLITPGGLDCRESHANTALFRHCKEATLYVRMAENK